jgi:hypothetical protein
MTRVRLGLIATLGLVCLASSVLFTRSEPPPKSSILDGIYS